MNREDGEMDSFLRSHFNYIICYCISHILKTSFSRYFDVGTQVCGPQICAPLKNHGILFHSNEFSTYHVDTFYYAVALFWAGA